MVEERLGFLIAGVQKAGTSALHAYLSQVPDLQLPAAKELHFFDNEALNWQNPDYGTLHGGFEADERLRGEATPITLYWPQALERALAYRADLKLVLLFRDPVERAFSQWQMEWARGTETLPFAEAIRSGRARQAAARPTPGFHRVWSYVERGFYGRQLARAQGLFGRERVLCVAHADLDRDPDRVVARICLFLGVPVLAAPLVPRRVRAAPAVIYPSVLTAADRAWLDHCFVAELARFAGLVERPADFPFLPA